MNRDDIDWAGYFPACVTPFHEDGALDLPSLAALVEHYVAEGMHGLVVNGTCGEWFSQNGDERREVAEVAVRTAAGRMTVLVGCTADTADVTVELARHALAAGADGVLVSPPPYAKLSRDEVVAFYLDVNAGIDGPLVVYNWPHGSGVDIDSDLADRLADIDQIVAIKDSTPSAEQFFETSRRVRDRVRVFGPYMSQAGLEVLRTEGGDGTVGGGSLVGRPDPEFWEACWRGDFSGPEAQAIAGRPALLEAVAARGLGRPVRCLPEPAEGTDADARPARRSRPPTPAARDRPGQPGRDARDPRRGAPAARRCRRLMGDSARLDLPRGMTRGPEVRLTIDGRPVVAHQGESLAAVLVVEEQLTTRRTANGEPRGVFCGMGVCFDCLVIVDGVPGTRACLTWAADGMRVERQSGPGHPLS